MNRLKKLIIPVDNLMQKKYRPELGHVSKYASFHKFLPFTSFVTLDLVKDPKVSAAARDYIFKLLQDKEKYGYLYFLNSQNLLIPLNVQFNGELVFEMCRHNSIVEEIDKMAKQFTCSSNELFFEITRIELLYFFTMLMNPHLNWIVVDSMLRCNKNHDYLIANLAFNQIA